MLLSNILGLLKLAFPDNVNIDFGGVIWVISHKEIELRAENAIKCPRVNEKFETLIRVSQCFRFGSWLGVLPDVEVCRGSQRGREGVWGGGRLGDRPRLWGTLHFLDCVSWRWWKWQPSLFCLFQNDVSEQEQRWGAKTIEGSGRKEHIR